jgi:hypothetical protein
VRPGNQQDSEHSDQQVGGEPNSWPVQHGRDVPAR